MWLSALLARWSGGCWNEALRPRAAGKAPFGDLRSFPRTVTSDGRYQVQPVGLSLRSHVLVYATSQFGLLAEVARSHRERKESLQWHATQPYPAAAEVADKSARWNLPWRRYPSTCGASKKWRRMKFFASSPALFAAFDSRFLRAWSPTWRSPPFCAVFLLLCLDCACRGLDRGDQGRGSALEFGSSPCGFAGNLHYGVLHG